MKWFLLLSLLVFSEGLRAEAPAPEKNLGLPRNPPALSARPAEPRASFYGKVDGVLGPVSLGPVVTLLGFPTPFRFGLESKYLDWAGLSFDYGFFPDLSFSGVDVKFHSWKVTARFFPFRRAFYVGLGLGRQGMTGNLSTNVEVSGLSVPVSFSLAVDTTILTPQIGWRWIGDSGFFFGMELGVQLAVSSTAALTSSAPDAVLALPEYQSDKSDIEDKGNTFGQITLPHFALAQLGFFF